MGDPVIMMIVDGWNVTEYRPVEHGIEVLGYSPHWEDPDYNPEGIRICFQNDGIWCSTCWNNYQDYYHTYYPSIIPTHWKPLPTKPTTNA